MFCKMTREYLAKKEVAFEDRDVSKNPAFLKELQDLGYATTPVTLIDGEVVVGFDQKHLDELLG